MIESTVIHQASLTVHNTYMLFLKLSIVCLTLRHGNVFLTKMLY